MMMIAINVRVAFHVICTTSPTSSKPTTPASSANTAPPHADHPIFSPFGCQITKVKVIPKISAAAMMSNPIGFSSSPKNLSL